MAGKLDRRTRINMSWTPEDGTYDQGCSGQVSYDTYKRTWVASVTFSDFYESIEPDNGEGDAVYFPSLSEGCKWLESIFVQVQAGKERHKIVGFQGHDMEAREKRATKEREAADAKA